MIKFRVIVLFHSNFVRNINGSDKYAQNSVGELLKEFNVLGILNFIILKLAKNKMDCLWVPKREIFDGGFFA